MARGDQLSRQWKIIQILFSSATGKTASFLAEELGCHKRTVYRDLEALQVAGFPLYTERQDGTTTWMVLDSAKRQTAVPFTLPELMALYFTSDLAGMYEGTIFSEASSSLFHKIQALLPPESKAFLDNVRDTITVSKKGRRHYVSVNQTLEQLNEAARNRNRVTITYFTMSRKEQSRRTVDPYCLWLFEDTFYLIGFCHLRKEIRIFALDRITDLALTGDSFTLPEDFDPEELMKPRFGIFAGEPTTVTVRFAPSAAGYIAEKVWHETQETFPQPDGSLLMTCTLAGTEEIKHWLLSWGAQVEVLEPASLREAMVKEARAMVERYGG